MKGIILLTLSLVLAGICYSQGSTERYTTSSQDVLTNIERYKVDYELVDASLFDQDHSIVSGINLNVIDYYRQPTEDVVFHDKRSGLEILIYSEERIAAGKSTTSGLGHPSKH